MTALTPTANQRPLVLNERYQVVERLGDRRLATVYRARDLQLERTVLVHVLRKELIGQEAFLARLQEEALALARRPHPALLVLLDQGVAGRRPYLVTEDVTGRVLRGLGPLSPEEALLYMRQLAGAVATCQLQGVPHPPLTSSNVVLAPQGRVQLVESWALSPEEVPLELARYRAPERTRGLPATPASAVYSLGLLLYEMVTGTCPISGDSPQAIAQAHLWTEIPPLRSVRPALYLPRLERMLAETLDRDPERRTPDAGTFQGMLDVVWREVNGETQRFAVPARRSRTAMLAAQGARQLITSALPPGVGRRRAPVEPAAIPGPGLEPIPVSKPAFGRMVTAWIVLLALFGVVAFGAYAAGTRLASWLGGGVQVPELPQPSLDLPGWLTGLVEGQGEVLVVTIDSPEGLNLRSEPGVKPGTVIDLLPRGTRVRRLAGPEIVDGVPWLRVAAEVNGRRVEGWVAQSYLRPEG